MKLISLRLLQTVLPVAVSPVFGMKLYMWFITNLFCANNYKLHIYIYQFCDEDR